MKIENSKVTQRVGYVLSFVIAFLPRLYWSLMSIPVRTISDEISTMNGAMLFAGYDWSAVVSHAGYYGFGMSMLMAPLAKVITDPVALYHALLIGAAVLESMAAVICYYILTKVFRIKDMKMSLLMTACLSFVTVIRTTVYYNEHMLMLLSWGLCLALAKLVLAETKKQRMLWTIVLCLITIYGMLIHARAVTYILVAFIVVALYWFMYRKWLVSVPTFSVLMIGGYVATKLAAKLYQNAVWNTAEGIGNTRVNIGQEKLVTLKTAEGIKAVILTIFGQVNIASMISAGLLIVALVMLVLMLVKRCKLSLVQKNYTAEDVDEKLYLVIGGFFVLCTGATIAAQCLTWINVSSQAVVLGYGNSMRGSKAFTYLRYMMPYLQPILMLILVVMVQKKEVFKDYYYRAIKYIVLLQGIWLAFVLPYCYGNQQASEEFICFALASRDAVTAQSYLPATLVLIVYMLILFWCCKKDKLWIGMALLLVMAGYKYCYNAYHWDIVNQLKSQESVDAVYQKYSESELKDILPEDIYCIDTRNAEDHQVYFILQYYLADKKVIPDYPAQDIKEAVLFTNAETINSVHVKQNYLCIKLDTDEYLWVKGAELQDSVMEALESVEELAYSVNLANYYKADGLKNKEETVHSNGMVGVFAHSSYRKYISGTYEVSYDIQAHGVTDEANIFTVELLKEGTEEVLQSQTLTGKELDEEGRGTLTMQCDMSDEISVEFRCSTTNAADIEILSLTEKRISTTEKIGALCKDQLSLLKNIADKTGHNGQIPFVTDNNSTRIATDFSVMAEIMGAEVYYCDKDDAIHGQESEMLLLMRNEAGSNLVYKLLEEYIVIGATEQYTLFLKKEYRQIAEDNQIEMYSSEKGLNLDYYYLQNDGTLNDDKKVALPYGEYTLTATGVHNDINRRGVLTHTYNEVENRMDIALGQEYTLRIAGMDGYHTSAFKYYPAAGLDDDTKFWLTQTDERNVVTYMAQHMMLQGDVTPSETGVLLGKEAGVKVFGPYAAFEPGNYIVTYRFERDSAVEGSLAKVDIAYGTQPIYEREVKSEDFKGASAEIVIEFSVTNEETAPSMEFRTDTYGVDETLRLVSVEVEAK